MDGKIIILEAMKRKRKNKMKNRDEHEDYEDNEEVDISYLAKEILGAIKQEEPDLLAESLKSFVLACIAKAKDEDMDEDEGSHNSHY